MKGKNQTDFKTVLISPPLSAAKQAGSLKDIANILPTLGIGYIAAVLEKDGIDVRIIDGIGEGMNLEQMMARITVANPEVIGLTATILTISTVHQLAGLIREKFPEVKLVLGGPQLCSAPEKTLSEGPYDLGVMGEGEETMLELVKAIREGKNHFEEIRGLIIKKNGKGIFTAPRPYIENIDSLPFPARHLYPPLHRYRPVPASYLKKPVGLMVTSRGCPYHCIFCDRRVFGNKFRAHSPQYVVEEMERVIQVHGAREIRFMDDTFTLDIKRVDGICEEIFKIRLKVPWTCLTRVNTVNPEILKKMKRAGCWQVIYGLESGDQKMLNIIRKGATVADNEKAVQWAKRAGLNVRATFVFGLPGETQDTIRKTIDFVKRVNLDVVNFFTVILFPGNELYAMAKREGKILHENYDEYTSLIDPQKTRLHYVPDGLTENELKNAIVEAYRSYYFRPTYLLRQVGSVRSLGDLFRYGSAFYSLLQMKKVSS